MIKKLNLQRICSLFIIAFSLVAFILNARTKMDSVKGIN